MTPIERLNAAGFKIEYGTAHVVHIVDLWDRRLILFFLQDPHDPRELSLMVDAFLAGRKTVLNELKGVKQAR